MRTLAVALAATLAVTVAPAASALPVFETSAGVKGSLGGNVWTDPDGTNDDSLGFGEIGGGGPDGGVGVYWEARFVRYLTVELGLLWQRSQTFRHVDFGPRTEITERFETDDIRIPLTVQGSLPVAVGRASLGLGPEFVIPFRASANHEVDAPPGVSEPTDLAIEATKKRSVLLSLVLALDVELPGPLEMPLDLRAGYNLSQSGQWRQRVPEQPTASDPTYRVKARHSWDIRFSLGLGWGS